MTAQVIPWLEVNLPNHRCDDSRMFEEGAFANALPGEKCSEFAVRGCEHFRNALEDTPSFILSTRKAGIDAYNDGPSVTNSFGVNIIGGLKTYDDLPGAVNDRPYDPASRSGWKSLAASARKIKRLTNRDVVLFDNEPTFMKHWERNAPVNLGKLSGSLVPLAKSGVEPWLWVPWCMFEAEKPWIKTNAAALVECFAKALPAAKFIVPYRAWGENSLNLWGHRKSFAEMRKIVGPERIIEILYVTKSGYWPRFGRHDQCFTVPEAKKFLANKHGTFIVYPGTADWIAVSQQWSEQPQSH